MQNVVFRKATATDEPEILNLLRNATRLMQASGQRQWDENYPAASHIRSDVSCGYAHILTFEENIAAYGAIIFDGEPAYEALPVWNCEEPYVTVHRFAVAPDFQKKGFAKRFLEETERLARFRKIKSLKIDTNFDNKPMLTLLDRRGFAFKGTVIVQGGERLAFEKLIE